MVERRRYLDRMLPWVDKPVIKVITGIRRCGKSTFMKYLMEYVAPKYVPKKRIIYINKDSLEFDHISTYVHLYEYVKLKKGTSKVKFFLFIDEIQEIEMWEKAIASFYADGGFDIYLTGSNADLMDSDLATLLTGRHIVFPMNTLVFSEFLTFRGENASSVSEEFGRFLKYGGFPGLHEITFEDEFVRQYIDSIYNTILLKDIVGRFQIRDVGFLERVSQFILDNVGNITSAKMVSDYVKSQHLKVSADTIQNYLKWHCKAFLAYQSARYDIRGKRHLEYLDKYFAGDIGFFFSTFGDRMTDISGKLENVVYLELLSREYTVAIGKWYDKEIDFIATKAEKKLYVQVCYLLADQDVIQREFGVLESQNDNYPKYVVSMDNHFGKDRNGVKWQNIIEFLLDETW